MKDKLIKIGVKVVSHDRYGRAHAAGAAPHLRAAAAACGEPVKIGVRENLRKLHHGDKKSDLSH